MLARSRALLNYELLELLLTFAVPRIDTKPIAKELLRRCGGLWGIFRASEAELQKVPGIGPRAALLMRLVHELAVECLRERLRGRNVLKSPESVVDYVRLSLAPEVDEVCLLLLLDNRNHVLKHEVVSSGTLDHASITPRKIVEAALSNKAAGFILVHNHPSGRPAPSSEDENLTRRVKSAANAVDLKFVDHLIVAADGHFSFRAAGLL